MLRSSLLWIGLLSVPVWLGCTAKPLPPKTPIAVQPAPAPRGEWRTTEQVIVITDASGTMYAAETFPEAKALTQSFIAAMPDARQRAATPRYEAGVVGFGGKDRVTAPVASFDRQTLATTADQIEIMGSIDGRGGETPLYMVFEEVADSIAPDSRRTAIVIFSDGIADFPEVTLASAEALAKSKGNLCYHGVQVGDDPEGTAFLQRLVGLTPCGSFRSASTLSDAGNIGQFSRVVFMESAPPLPAVSAPPPTGADPCKIRVSFGGVNFDFNKASLRPEAGPVLEKWSERLSECPSVALQIEGNTDSTGPEVYNMGLSERRALTVRDYLVGEGIGADRLNPVGRGENYPVATNSTPEGRAENRRVEIIAQ